MFNFKSLPVAPEFVEALQEHAQQVIFDNLEAGNMGPEVIELIKSTFNLSYYVTECYRDPKTFLADRKDRFDIENVVIESINQVVNLGGAFQGAYTIIFPRKGTVPMPAKSKK